MNADAVLLISGSDTSVHYENIVNKNHGIKQSFQDFTIFFCDFCDRNDWFCRGNFQKFV